MLFLTLLGCNTTVTVNFEVNGGEPIEALVLDGNQILSGQLPTPVKTGYAFAGWFYDAEFTSAFDIQAILLGETTLYAKWTINHPTLVFDSQGGSDVEAASQDYGTVLTAPAAPTREGYTFGGWYAEAACTTPYVFDTMPAEGLTVYAKWTLNQYTVTFMVDGEVYATRTVNHGADLTDLPTVPAKTGFGGAWDVMDFSGITEDMTVTAVYSDNYYTITFVNQFGTALGTVSVKHGNNVPTPEDPAPVEGYNFVGWTGYNFASPSPVSGPLTVTASYQIKVFSVAFYGVTGLQIGDVQQIQWNQPATAPSYTAPEGYTLTGWSVAFDHVTANLTVNATFTLVSYTVAFDENDGSAVADITADYLAAISKPADPTRPGYHFVGWFSDEACTVEYVFTAQSTMPLHGMTLYAGWEESEFTVSFESNGGSAAEAVKVTFHDTFGTLPSPTKTGYSFAGWYLETGLTTKVESTTVYSATSDVTLYAKWTINSYTLSFAVDGGSAVTAVTQEFASALSAPVAPTKAGYTFAGWYAEEALTTPYVFATMPAGDFSVYAKWTVNSYTVSFDANGGSAVDPISGDFGTAVSAPVAPTRDGYTFVTWCTDSEATLAYTFSTMPAQNLTLYAKWAALTDIPYTAEYYVLNLDETTYTLLETDGTFRGATDSTVSVTPKAITGYSYNASDVHNVLSGTVAADGSLVLKVYYSRNTDTAYVVEHWYQPIFGSTYTKAATDNLTGTTGATVTATAKTEEGFTYYPAYPTTVTSGTVNAAGTLVLKLYYNRNVYTIVQDFGDGRPNSTFTIRFGQDLTPLANPTREGYTFQGWVDELGTSYPTTSIPNRSLDLFASWRTKTFLVTVIREFYQADGTTLVNTQSNGYYLPYDTLYAPVVDIVGNDFVEVEGPSGSSLDPKIAFKVTDNMTLTVSYKVRTLYIDFIQNPTGLEAVGTRIEVAYGGDITSLVPALTPRDGYTVIWDHSLFAGLTENMTVFAFYYAAGVKSVTFHDAGTITNLISQEGSAPEVITADNLQWVPSKTGYRFDGWFTAAEGGTQWLIGDMLWANVTDNLNLYAHWTLLSLFPTPSAVQILNGTQTVTWIQGKADGVLPSSYDILVDGTLYTVLASACTVDAVTGEVSYTFADGRLTAVGSHTVTVTAKGDGTNQMSSPASAPATIVVETAETDDPGEVLETKYYDYFIVEKTATSAIYVFYSDMIYNFNAGYTLAILSGTDLATASANKLTTGNLTGSFRFSVTTNSTGVTKNYFGKVIANINQFALGTSLSNYKVETLSAYLDDETLDPYLVGTGSSFYFDLKILNNAGERVDQNDCELIYTFSLWNESTLVYDLLTTTLPDYVTVIDQSFLFQFPAVGKKFKVEIAPKYQANQMTVPTLSFEFTVNNGVNVFTSDELQAAFGDFNVNAINVHSTIVCELRPDQTNPDGSPINGSFLYDGEGNYVGGGEGAVYSRLGAMDAGINDVILINGNYFTIDGSGLPYMNVNSDPTGEWKNVGFAKSFVVVDSRVGIFNYAVGSGLTTNDNTFRMNNLTIIGNTVTPSVNYNLSPEEIASAEALMSLNSGGYNGIVLKNGTNTFHNVNILQTVMGVFNTARFYQSDGVTPNYMYADYVHVDESWASSFLGYDISGFIFTNCDIGTSGGAAIHVEDASSDSNDPVVSLDTATVINNWISGQEAWFKVYGMTTTVTTLKAAIDSGIAPLGKTVIQTKTNPTTGLQTEMINFMIFQLPREGAYTTNESGTRITGSQIEFQLPDANGTITDIHRAFNFMDTDVRDSGGNFVFPVGYYSDLTNFYNGVVSLMGEYSVDQATAGNLVYIDAFYNLRSLNPYLAGAGADSLDAAAWIGSYAASHGGVSLSAVQAFMTAYGLPLVLMPTQPRFLEVQATFDGKVTGGVASIILGIYNK